MADELVTIIDKPVKLDLDIGDTTVVRVAERDHSKLENLDYEHSGHTGFASQAYADTLYSRITQNEQGIENNSNRITELGKIVNVVRESIPTKTSEIENDSDYTTKEYVDTQLGATTVKISSLEENKLDKTGGVITGNLTVAGTVTTEKQKTLEVEDNIVYTNANKVALQALLSGLAIYKDGTNLYGILYDPATDSVKLGAGYRDASGIFHFNANDGSPVAVREDSSKLTDKHIMIWNSATNKLIDSGKTVDEFIDLISEQTIGGLKKFAEQIQANKGIHSDGDIIANNANLKAMDTTKDAVAQYGADKITLDANNDVVEIALKSLYNATHYIRYKEDEPTPPTPTKEAGLYVNGVLSKTWAQLLSDGDITITDGALKVGNTSLVGDLVCDNIEGLTSLSLAFSNCERLTSIDVSKLDTSNVTSMSGMFSNCSGLTSIDASKLDTSKVTSMSCMFENCSTLTSLDVSNFNTSNVTDMTEMFYSCGGLTSLDVSKFHTLNVKNMTMMFFGCSGLTSLDLSNFNTSNVRYMQSMFQNCRGLTSLDVSKFHTLNVKNMTMMFFGCSGLTSLDLSNFNTSNVRYMQSMFQNCRGLTSLDLSNFNTSNVRDMTKMFFDCSGLTSLDLSNFNTSKVTSMSCMFENCSTLTSLDVSNFNTSNVTDMTEMFYSCGGLTSLDISSFTFDKVTSYSGMFDDFPANCEILVKSQTEKDWITSKFTNLTNVKIKGVS